MEQTLRLEGHTTTGQVRAPQFALEPAGRSYVRAELRGHRGRPERGEVVWAMGNPIWFKVLNVTDGFGLLRLAP